MQKPKTYLLFLYILCVVFSNNNYADSLRTYDPDNMWAYSSGEGWINTTKDKVKRGQEFICDNHLCYFEKQIGALSMNPHVDIKLLPEASRVYDPNNWHFPEPTDIVRFVSKSYKHIRFERMGTARVGDHFVYQGKLYNTVYDPTSPTRLSIEDAGLVLSRVVKTYKHPQEEFIKLTVADVDNNEYVITGTKDHPFFVPTKSKYIFMGDLEVGEALKTDDGSLATIKSLRSILGNSMVYNIEVEGTSNYYVRSPDGGPVVNVHNCNKVKGTQIGFRDPGQIDQIKSDMLSDNFRYSSPEGKIAGSVDSKGTFHISEGHHRMAAAQEIYKETGDATHVNKLLSEGLWTPTKSVHGSRPLPSRNAWQSFRNRLGL